jgi:uncharacterized protein
MTADKANIEAIKILIVEKLKGMKPTRIILFGSYAYGNPDWNSDIDICVVNKGTRTRTGDKREIRNRLKDLQLAKDILVTSKSEFDFYCRQFGSVFMEIKDKGITLWSSS